MFRKVKEEKVECDKTQWKANEVYFKLYLLRWLRICCSEYSQ